jgi:tetratricopeptide (TPR) repeat protein
MKRTLVAGIVGALALSLAAVSSFPLPTWARQEGRSASDRISDLVHAGIEKANAGYLDEAVQLFDRALHSKNADPRAYLNRGKVFLIQGQVERAVKDLTQAVELAPDMDSVRLALGMAQRRRGNLTDALTEFSAVLEKDPSAVKARILRAAVHFDSGQPDLALQDLARVLKAAPQSVTALGNRAYILEQMGQYEEALQDLTRVVALDPDNIMAMKHLGYVCNLKGDRKAALRWYEMAMNLEVRPAGRRRLAEEVAKIQRRMEH